MSKNVKIAQINMNRRREVSEQIRDFCRTNNIDVLLVQEPPLAENGRSVYDLNFGGVRTVMMAAEDGNYPGAAILILNMDLRVITPGHQNCNMASAIILEEPNKQILLLSVYFKYNMPTINFTEMIRKAITNKDQVIIGADTNAHSHLWHCPDTNSRGSIVKDLIEDLDLKVLNKAGMPKTYMRKDMGSSNIDVTMVTSMMESRIDNWRVLENETDSDHRIITFTLTKHRLLINKDERRFLTSKANWPAFTHKLSMLNERIPNIGDVHERARTLTELITLAAKDTIPRQARKTVKLKPPWWTTELDLSKKILNKTRRDLLILGNDETRKAHCTARNAHVHAIRVTKMKSWRSFAEDLNKNPWGKAFKWIKKGSDIPAPAYTLKNENGVLSDTAEETAKIIMNNFVPEDADGISSINLTGNDTPYNPTYEEVKRAIWGIKPNKAPGLDCITAGILRKAWPVIGRRISEVFRSALQKSIFPESWKEANVVLLLKDINKDKNEVKSYRPVSLLPTLSKALEKLMVNKMETEVLPRMNQNQHGFTQGKSTRSAINAVLDWTKQCQQRYVLATFLDITGAFDNLSWVALFDDLDRLGATVSTRRMLRSYLIGRKASFKIEGKRYQATMKKGCPQGSKIGPLLWNIGADKALDSASNHLNGKSITIAYADDLVVLVGASRIDTAKTRMTARIDELIRWANHRGLSFSTRKSQVMCLKGGKKPDFSIEFGTGHMVDNIVASGKVKYLGVTMDYKLNYWSHIVELADKGVGLFSKLRGLMSANWGVTQGTARMLYKAVFLPKILYAADIWAQGAKTQKARKKLDQIQRRALLAVTGAYRTTSTHALQVVAGLLPLDLEVKITVAKLRAKEPGTDPELVIKTEREVLDEWQDRWRITEKGRWSFKMIPDVRVRYRLPLTLDHYTTQMLTGHGDFKGKLHSFKLVNEPSCSCGRGSETANHVLLACGRVESSRLRLKRALSEEGEPWPPREGSFLKSRKTYEALRSFSTEALRCRLDR